MDGSPKLPDLVAGGSVPGSPKEGRQPERNTPSTPGYNRLRNSISWSVVLDTWARFLKQPR